MLQVRRVINDTLHLISRQDSGQRSVKPHSGDIFIVPVPVLVGPADAFGVRLGGVHTGEEILELINPSLVETDGEQVGPEGCLSVPGKYGLVKRPYYAKVRAQDRDGNWYEAEGEELIARCFCHELDHLDGIIYTEVMERFLTEEELLEDEE